MNDKPISDNIISFPGHPRGSNEAMKEERKAALSEKQFEQSKTRIRAAIDAKKTKRPLLKESERIRFANNLWRIFQELNRNSPPVTPRDVLYAAGQGQGTDSTKRLPYFALDPDLPALVRDKRARKLQKKFSGYEKLVSKAVELSGKDELVLMRTLIYGTWYSPTTEDIEAAEEDIIIEGWANIETAVKTIGANVTRKYNLPRFFKLVSDLAIESDLTDALPQRAPLVGRLDLRDMPLPALVRTDELPPHPSVYLGEIRVCDDIPCVIHVGLGLGDGEIESELRERVSEALLERASLKGSATPVLLAWLELIPLGRQNAVTPVLRLTSTTYVASAEDFDEFVTFGGEKWRAGDVVGEFDGPIELENYVDNDHPRYDGLRVAAYEDLSESWVEIQVTAGFEPTLGTGYDDSLHSRSAVDGSWVGGFDDWARGCLSKEAVTKGKKRPFQTYCHETALAMKELGVKVADADELTLFPAGTMTALLDRSLFVASKTARLDCLLDEKALGLTRRLEAKIEEARARRRERLDEIRRG
ncbi:MAG: hypothetical protein JO223_14885 [Hyphomicrobiales bacterium]|nr:hypothetical protein [Hyphomicrobiales bacterium]